MAKPSWPSCCPVFSAPRCCLICCCLRCLKLRAAGRLLLAGAALAWACCARRAAQAQILDDSTQNRYGARTTFILKERDLLRDDTVGRMIDTTLTRLPQQRYWTHDTTFQQDLGNFGTASRPLLWEPNRQLGARLGRNAFDQYARDAADVKYYDTRSPYTFFRFFQGNPYEQVFELSYTRSLQKAGFNVGFNYERFGSNKSVAATNTRTGPDGAQQLSALRPLRVAQRPLPGHGQLQHRPPHGGRAGRHRAPDGARRHRRQAARVDLTQLFDYQREVVNLTRPRTATTATGCACCTPTGCWAGASPRFTSSTGTASSTSTPTTSLCSVTGDRQPVLSAGATEHAPLPTTGPSSGSSENTVGVMGQLERRCNTASMPASASIRSTRKVAYRRAGRGARYRWPGATARRLFLGGTAAFSYRQFAIETAGEIKPSTSKTPTQTEYWLRRPGAAGPAQRRGAADQRIAHAHRAAVFGQPLRLG